MRLNLEYIKKHQNRILLILGILAFIILVIVLIIQITSRIPSDETPRTRIENWSEELSHVPQDTRIRAEQKLYSQIEMNSSNNVPTSGAKIRKDTQTTLNIGSSFVMGDFIVDIPRINQSYVVQYYYGQLENQTQEPEISVSIDTFCITNPNKRIYPDFPCKDNYGAKNTEQYITNTYLSFYLPHTETLSDNKTFTVDLNSITENQIKLVVSVNSCGDKSIMQAAETAAKKWVNSLNLNVTDISYITPTQYNDCLITSSSNIGTPINIPTVDRNMSLTLSVNNTSKEVLSNLMGDYTTQKLFSLLEKIVFNAVTTENTSVTATVLPSSFITIDKPSFTEHSMIIQLSDDRSYTAEIANKKNRWCGIILHQRDSEDYPHLYISGSIDTNYDATITDILDWAKELYPDGILVTTENIYY